MITLSNQPFFTAEGIFKNFRVGQTEVEVLKNISFGLCPQSFNILFGPSGSGKTTLLNCVVGLDPPSSGTVKFHDLDLYSLDQDELATLRMHRFGMVFQHPYWIQSLNVIENVALPLHFLGFDEAVCVEAAREHLKIVGMEEFEKTNPASLSGGQQQRVGLARALVTNPWIIVADEPTGNLDSKAGDDVMKLLYHMCKKIGRTVLLVTHNAEYIVMADFTIYIKDGQLSTKEEAMTKPIKIELEK